jgi:hypothetical protein
MPARLTVAIMQPYFFPYLGYFQLIAHSDVFVIHDDAQYIKGGWINRNRILTEGRASWLTLPVSRGAHDAAINGRRYQLDPSIVDRLLRRIDAAYATATTFKRTSMLVHEIMTCADSNVATFNARLLQRIAGHLAIPTRFVFSSQIAKDARLTGQERVIDLCARLGATQYVNSVGGSRLYQADRFAASGIELSFFESTVSPYKQFGQTFVPSLSIIDTLMFNSDQAMAGLLKQYRRIEATTGPIGTSTP